MNTVTKWEADELQRRLSRLFGLSSPRPANSVEGVMAFGEWMPLVDISQDDREWCLKADLPDVKMEDLSVTVENGVLLLMGERKFEEVGRGRKYYCMERACGEFALSFLLPEGADGINAVVEHKGGVLTVYVPKNEKVNPKAVGTKTG